MVGQVFDDEGPAVLHRVWVSEGWLIHAPDDQAELATYYDKTLMTQLSVNNCNERKS